MWLGSIGFTLLPLWTLILIALTSTSSSGQLASGQYCHVETVRQTRSLQLGLLVNIHRAKADGRPGCGAISPWGLQEYLAIKWILEELSRTNFIKGVPIGLVAMDTCERDDVAASMMMRMFPQYIPTNCTDSKPQVVGLLGCGLNSQSELVERTLHNSNTPLLSYSSTANRLTEQTSKPSNVFFRTVPNDKTKIQVLKEMVMKLEWTYVAIVHSKDPDGVQLAGHLTTSLQRVGICIATTESIDAVTVNSAITAVEHLVSKLANTQDPKSLGVLYVGQEEPIKALIRVASNNAQAHKLRWIISDALGPNDEFLQSYKSIGRNVLSFSSTYLKLNSFVDYWLNTFTNLTSEYNDSDAKWLQEYHEAFHHCKFQPSNNEVGCASRTAEFIHSQFRWSNVLQPAIDAVYGLANAVWNLHREKCGRDNSGICAAMAAALPRQLINYVSQLDLTYSYDSLTFLPPEFTMPRRRFQFSKSGNIMNNANNLAYGIYNFQCTAGICKNVKVGDYGSKLSLSLTSVKFYLERDSTVPVDGTSLPKSHCRRFCQSCIQSNITKFAHIPGDVYIVGFFPIHGVGDGPFDCGKVRTTSGSLELMEGFLYAIGQIRGKRGMFANTLTPHIGAIAFDSCYNKLLSSLTVAKFHRGELVIRNPLSGEVISPSKVIAYIGGMSSSVSIDMADILSEIPLVQVSYGSTSPALFKYKNFLRTVPADDRQTKAMMEVVKKLADESGSNVNAISVVYAKSAYGIAGYESIKMYAKAMNICISIAEPLDTSPHASSAYVLNKLLSKSFTKIVILFMDAAQARNFLLMVKSEKIRGQFTWIGTESWGDRKTVIEGLEDVVEGVITLKVSHRESMGFNQYFNLLRPGEYTDNPWFNEYWESLFKCSLPYRDYRKFYDKACDPDKTFQNTRTMQDQFLAPTINAIYSIALGTSNLLKTLCSQTFPKVCSSFYRAENLPAIVQAIKAVNLTEEGNNQSFRVFADRGDANAVYHILNLQKFNNKDLKYVKIGTFDNVSGLQMVPSTVVTYNKLGMENKKFPPSYCVSDCGDCTEGPTPEPPKQAKFIYKHGAVMLCALFPIHLSGGAAYDPGAFNFEGFLALEAFQWALDQVNSDSLMLPGIKIGLLALDTYSSAQKAGSDVHLVVGPSYFLPKYADIDPQTVLAFLTGADAAVSMATATFLTHAKVVQMDYATGTSDFDNHKNYPYFVRAANPVMYEIKGLIAFMKNFKLYSASVVYSDDLEGRDSLEVWTNYTSSMGICTSTTAAVSPAENVAGYTRILRTLYEYSLAGVKTVVLFLQPKEVDLLFQTASRYRREDFAWLGGSKLAEGLLQINSLSRRAADGATVVIAQSALPSTFTTYMDTVHSTDPHNPWISEYSSNSSKYKTSLLASRLAQNVINSVFAFASGFDDLLQDQCKGTTYVCPKVKEEKNLAKYLKDYIQNNEKYRLPSTSSITDRFDAYMYNTDSSTLTHLDKIGSFPLNLTYFNLTVYNSPWSRVSSKCLVHSRCGHCEKEDKKVLPVKQECDYSFPTSLAVSLAVLAVLLLVNIILIVLLCRMCHRQANKEKKKPPENGNMGGFALKDTPLPPRPVGHNSTRSSQNGRGTPGGLPLNYINGAVEKPQYSGSSSGFYNDGYNDSVKFENDEETDHYEDIGGHRRPKSNASGNKNDTYTYPMSEPRKSSSPRKPSDTYRQGDSAPQKNGVGGAKGGKDNTGLTRDTPERSSKNILYDLPADGQEQKALPVNAAGFLDSLSTAGNNSDSEYDQIPDDHATKELKRNRESNLSEISAEVFL